MARRKLDATDDAIAIPSGRPDATGARLRDRDGAAHYLQLSTRTIDRLIETGQLPVVRFPVERAANSHGQLGATRRVLIDVKDLDALIERSKETVR